MKPMKLKFEDDLGHTIVLDDYEYDQYKDTYVWGWNSDKGEYQHELVGMRDGRYHLDGDSTFPYQLSEGGAK